MATLVLISAIIQTHFICQNISEPQHEKANKMTKEPKNAKMTTQNWTASSEFGTYRLCEQRRFRRACASAQSRQNLRCSLIQAVSQEEPSDRKTDPWSLWMAGHAQLKFVMAECSKTQIRLTGLNYRCTGRCFTAASMHNYRFCDLYNWAASWPNQQNRPVCLIRVFAVRSMGS